MNRRLALVGALGVLGLVGFLNQAAQELFAFHMAQHLLLIALAAPLAVLGGLTIRLKAIWAWSFFVGVFLFWHLPATFQWTARHQVEVLELASIFAAALPFWSAALGEGSLSAGSRALMVMTAAIVTDLPGVVMLFASRPFCVMPQENATRFGITPLQDQQIAGLLMWVPANLVFFAIATFLFARWMNTPRTVTS
ncbi:MAG TPA: cytochrome c oxidase assembly protein [Rhizomicrobium sp.]|nr:cytochrome c oxidase assembly protein [Rhizomicrobium sp.]